MRGRRMGLLHWQSARVVAAVDALRVAAAEKAKRNFWPLVLCENTNLFVCFFFFYKKN